MKKRTLLKSSSRRQQGVALIIVLAMLTILLALAITLSATTRAERGVVRVHTEVTNTRQLVHAAISRAMTDIELQSDAFLGGRGHSNAGWEGDGGAVIMSSYPRKRFIYAYTNPVAGHHLGVLSTNEMELLLSEESREFFTHEPNTQALIINPMTNTVSNPNAEDDFAHWMGLRMNRQRGDNSRFTYVAENLSDGIDVNHAFKDYESGALTREYGRASSEVNWLPVWNITGLASSAGDIPAVESTIHDFANEFGRVDNMRELNYYLPDRLGVLPVQAYQFCTFTAEPELDRVLVMMPDGTPQMLTISLAADAEIRKVDVSGTVAEWEARVADLDVQLGRAFELCQVRGTRPAFTLDQLRSLIAGLKDYVDPDVYVTDETLAGVEPVPMFNEVAFSAKLTDVARVSREEYTYTVDVIPVFELWWPFLVEDGESFSLEVDAQVTITVNGKNADGDDVSEPTVTTESISASSLTGSLADPFITNAFTVAIDATSSVVLNATNNLLNQIEVSVNFTGMKIAQGSETCDSVSGLNLDTVLRYDAATPPIAVAPVPDGVGQALVIVNEFGDVGLDHDLIASSDDDVIELAGGCACCVVRGDLSRTLLDVLERRRGCRVLEFERIVIETSGLAEPGPMLQMIMSDPGLNACLQRPSVLCTFDAEHGERNVERFPEAAHQLAQSDAVIVTKTDLVDDALARASAVIESLLPGTAIFDGRHLRGAPQLDVVPKSLSSADEHASHAHTHGIRSIEVALEDAVPVAVVSLFLELLVRQFGDRILRVKGLVACEEIPGQPLVVQGVHHTFFPLELLDEWPAGRASSRLVIIANAPLTAAWCKLALAALIADVAHQSVSGQSADRER